MMAAALYFRGDALICAHAAGVLWGVLDTTQQPDGRDPIDVLVVGRSARGVSGVRVHRIASLARQDIRRRKGIPVTSPARTILDLAATMDELELEAVLSVGLSKRVVRLAQLKDVIERNPRVRGITQLRGLLNRPQTLHDTRSTYERKLLRLLTQAELPLPITNIKLAGKLVDAYWPDLKLVIEFDIWKYHRERDSFESDRLTDQHLTAAGHHVMRITARQVDHAPYALVARLAAMITALRLSSAS